MIRTIWERYFISELKKVFALFLFSFYGLYVLIDYSTHTKSFKNYNFDFLDITGLYLYDFVMRMEVLVPFAILIAVIKTLSQLNTNNELIALMAGGIKLKRILRPFVLFGLFFTLLMYLNTEFLQPRALKYHKQVDLKRAQAKQKKHNHSPIRQLILEDGSTIIFQNYDEADQQLFDVFWIKSINDIYRMKTLSPYSVVPIGHSVEHLVRNEDKTMTVAEFIDQKEFPEIHFDKNKLQESVTTPDDLSLTQLAAKWPKERSNLSEKEAKIVTVFYYKMAMPWLCLLAAIAPAPFAVRFTRTLPIFFIYAGCIFGLVAFYLVMDAALILGERQVVSPEVAIWVPFGAFFAFFGWKFYKL
jgi:lipopolysaccharide export system permease protein